MTTKNQIDKLFYSTETSAFEDFENDAKMEISVFGKGSADELSNRYYVYMRGVINCIAKIYNTDVSKYDSIISDRELQMKQHINKFVEGIA